MKAHLVIVGPPGAGKGTQAKFIAERLGIPAISTGAIFRDNMARGTELGKLAEKYINDGNLVPDEVTTDMLDARVHEPDAVEGFLLDGYPRNVNQVHSLDKFLAESDRKIDAVIELRVDDEILVDRLMKRADIEQREDDTEDVIRHRLDVYHETTQPIIDIYAERGLLVSVDGVGDIPEVLDRIINQVREFLGN